MTRTVAFSEVRVAQKITAGRANPAGRVLAGDIMQLMYNAAHKVAQKHAGKDVTAVVVDEMVFLHPLPIGAAISAQAALVFVGKTSMEVEVNLYLEGMPASKPALTAYFVMVALDAHQQPTPVLKLEVSNEKEMTRFTEGMQRYNVRRAKRGLR